MATNFLGVETSTQETEIIIGLHRKRKLKFVQIQKGQGCMDKTGEYYYRKYYSIYKLENRRIAINSLQVHLNLKKKKNTLIFIMLGNHP